MQWDDHIKFSFRYHPESFRKIFPFVSKHLRFHSVYVRRLDRQLRWNYNKTDAHYNIDWPNNM